MSKNSPSARYHRALVFLAHLEQYERLGPLIGPKEEHQPNPRWEKQGRKMDKDLPAEAWIEHLASLLARARFGSGVDMGGAHQPLPSERRIAAQYVQDLCEWMEQQR